MQVTVAQRQPEGTPPVESVIEADKVLVTVGRRPNSDGLGLDRVGVRIDPKGFVPTDRQMRTNVPSVFAIGRASPNESRVW